MSKPTLTVVIPTKDEKGTIEPAVTRMPDFGVETELLFVDGNSRDGTPEELERVRAAYPHKRINWFTQEGKGKRIAVWQGFERAWGETLIILDGDITVPPEELPGVYEHLTRGPHVFVNCTRFRRRMEKGAMQAPNFVANVFFSVLVSIIVGKSFTDTLCGTKGIWKSTFLVLRERGFLADIDRYGDHRTHPGRVESRLPNRRGPHPLQGAALRRGQDRQPEILRGNRVLEARSPRAQAPDLRPARPPHV